MVKVENILIVKYDFSISQYEKFRKLLFDNFPDADLYFLENDL